MTRLEARKKLLQSIGACFLAFVMILTNVLGAVEVYAAGKKLKAPTINPVSIGAKEITGTGLIKKGQRSSKKAVCKIIVTVKDADDNEKETQTFSIEPTEKDPKGSVWSVKLTNPVQEGYKVYAKQVLEGKTTETSEEVFVKVQKLLAEQYKEKLKMPSGDIWIEQTSSNQVNDDEQAEAVQKLKDANTAIAGDFSAVKFSINTAEHAYYEVTYTDGSTSGEIEATNLKIKQVKDYSQAPTIAKTYVADGKITITLKNEIAAGTKIGIIETIDKTEVNNFCSDEEDSCANGKCNFTKTTVTWVTVDKSTKTFTHKVADDFLELGNEFGVIVKEPHKFASCKRTTPKLKIPNVGVRDPKKLTETEKDKIREEIRKANTTKDGKGVSKLPDWTANNIPAFIEFDKDGNVKIVNPVNVQGDWDNDGNFVPKRNPDGSLKMGIGVTDTGIPVEKKDLVNNLPPKAPEIKLSDDKKNITITPDTADTDAKEVSVTYTGADGGDKKTVAKKENGTWKITEGEGSVDNNGVITLPVDKVKGETEVKANVKDDGFQEAKQAPGESSNGTLTVPKVKTKAEQVTELGGLDPVVLKKWVKDTVDWKDGVKAKDSAKKTDVNKLLEGATFTDATDTTRKTDSAGTKPGKIKVKFDDGSELTVENQTLYVSNHVTSKDAQNLPDDALDVEFRLGEGTKVNNTGSGAIEGNKNTPTLYQKYKVKPNTNLKDYKLPAINQSVVDSIKLSAQEGYVDPVWNTQDFTATESNKTFTATATKAYVVTVEPNNGGGTATKAYVKPGDNYKLPAKDIFTPPNDNQEFSGWQVGDDSKNLKQPGTQIQINGDTTVKAIWKAIEYKVSFQAGTGASGDMTDVTVTKGSDYPLPVPTFNAPTNKEFAGWQVPGESEVKQAGATIRISGNVTLTATWKDQQVDITFDKGEGAGEMEKKTVNKGSQYKLPDSTFKAPANKEFAGWKIGDDSEVKKPGTEITVSDNTKLTAVYKDQQVDITFDKGEGTGEMEKKTVNKGSQYKLPDSTFKAPANKEFAGWKVGDDSEVKAVGTEITVSDNTKLTAAYKDIQSIDPPVVSVDKNTGNLMITPPTPPQGQELKSLTVTYKDSTGAEKTAVAEKSADGWSLVPAATNDETVDSNSGVITIPKGKYKLEEVVKAFANNQVNQKSDVANATPVEVSFDVNGGSKKVESSITIKGESYVLPAIYELPEYLLTVPQGKEFAGWEVDGQIKKAGESIKVDKNTVVKALWKAKPADPSKPDAPAEDHGNYLILEKVEPTEPKVEWEIGRHYKYLYGYPDGSVHPEGQITRAEAAGLIARLAELDLSNKAKPNFKDTPSRWYNSAINVMVAKDLMFADKNGNFRPNEPITRGEFARALYYIDKKNNVVAPFADVKGHEFEAAINQAYGNGRIAGYPDGSFRPDAYIQRAEAARMLNQYADRSVSLEGMAGVKKDVIRFTDINESHWAYYEVMEAANTHDYRRAKGTLPETWVRIIQKDDRVAR